MLCSRCGKNEAKITVEYSTDIGKVNEYFCEECYEKRRLPRSETVSAAPRRAARCPFCGNSMEDYLHSGLVGCAECYRVFAEELSSYIVRLQGSGRHCGKRPSALPKYEAAQSLRETLAQLDGKPKDEAQAKRLKRKAEELELLIFGDDEEE